MESVALVRQIIVQILLKFFFQKFKVLFITQHKNIQLIKISNKKIKKPNRIDLEMNFFIAKVTLPPISLNHFPCIKKSNYYF